MPSRQRRDIRHGSGYKKTVPALKDLIARLGKGDKIRNGHSNNANDQKGVYKKMFLGGMNAQMAVWALE